MDTRFDFTVINGKNLRIDEKSDLNSYNRCNRSENVMSKRKTARKPLILEKLRIISWLS